MKKLKINFVDFWPNFLKTDNYFANLLATKYDIEIDEVNPDVLFFSVDYANQKERLKYKDCLRIFYTGEDVAPNWNECDIGLTFRHSTDIREYRLPLWALHLNWFKRPYNDDRDHAYMHSIENFLTKPKNIDKTKFCAFVASQPKGKRVDFVPKLSSIKRVDCAGRLHNNMNGVIRGRGDQKYKIDWYKPYKFNITMENTSSRGYATEKIIDAMFANCIPIYWGSESIADDFNPNSFINCHNFNSDEAIIDYIFTLDNDDVKYQTILEQPWFSNGIPDFVQPENVLRFIDKYIK